MTSDAQPLYAKVKEHILENIRSVVGEWNALFSSADVASCRSQLACDRGIGHVSVASKLAPTTAHATAHASSTQTSTAASSPLAVPAHSLLLLRGRAAASKAPP